MTRLILIAIPCSIIAAGLMYAMAAFNGLDPMAPEVRTIAWVSLAVAGYVGLRLAMVINRYLKTRDAGEANRDGGSSAAKAGTAFKSWGRSSTLDARMEARRRRVEAAKAKQAAAEEGGGET